MRQIHITLRLALARLRAFAEDNRAAVAAEAVIVLPFVLWAYLATFQYYDAFGTITRNLRASYTIADLISRETNTVTPSYIQGLNSLYGYLNRNPPGVWTRVTEVGWQPPQGNNPGRYYVSWSYATNANPALTNTTLQSFVPKLPTIVSGDTLLMVETHMQYTPLVNFVGMTKSTFKQLVITRPRISPQIVFSAS